MHIKEIYQELFNANDLRPSAKINRLFSELVWHVTNQPHANCLFKRHEVRNLQRMCSQGESHLEKYWANKVIHSKNPSRALEQFPYFDNYLKLVELEVASLGVCKKHTTHNILFCGGGALPMTAIILAKQYGISSTIIDSDPEAVALSQKLVQSIGLQDQITILHEDATSFQKYESFSVIYIAALVGLSAQIQQQVFSHIKTVVSKDTHILARSSYGNRTLLYRPISEKIVNMFHLALAVHPQDDIVNSVLILTPKF